LESLGAEGGDSLQEGDQDAARPSSKRQYKDGDAARSLWPMLWRKELKDAHFSGGGSYGQVFVYTVRCDGQAKLAVKTSMDSVTAEFEVAQHLLGHRFIRRPSRVK